MTRQDYIYHLDALRKGVLKIIAFDREEKDKNGGLSKPTSLEQERAKKTQKMFDDLVVRLYEDAAVSEKIKHEKLLAGDIEQAELTFPTEALAKDEESEEAEPEKAEGGAK